MKHIFRWFGRLSLGLAGLLVVLALVLAISNRSLPRESAEPERLSDESKAHIAEAMHLRGQLGDDVWPGWGDAAFPVILYNEAYAFLVNYPDEPPVGWFKVPDDTLQGGAWTLVEDDDFGGEPYYRQPLTAGVTPQSFVVRVGDEWVASITTKEWARVSLIQGLREELPPLLAPVFPYRLFAGELINSSDHFIALLLHETFHAHQGLKAPRQLARAELAVRQVEDGYPWADPALTSDWQKELDLLGEAMAAESVAESRSLAEAFLTARAARRESSGLSPNQIAYEQRREWLEGGAKYVELVVWRQGGTSDTYEPVPATGDDPDFDDYERYERQWQRESDQLGRMAGDSGDGRFYYSGWAQGVLLDRLAPDWKTTYWEGVPLEDLLTEVAFGAAR